MIELVTEPLPDAARATLRAWLTQGGADIAAKLCHARCQLRQAKALAEAVNGSGTDETRSLVSSEAMRQAARYSTFIEVLQELADDAADKTKLQTVKLKPYASLQIQIPSESDAE